MKDLVEEVRTMGTDATRYRAMVTTDTRSETISIATEKLENLRWVLVLAGPDSDTNTPRSKDLDVSVVRAGGESIGYSMAAYFSVAQFLMERNVHLPETLFFLPNADHAIERAMLDIQWFQSSMAISLLARAKSPKDLLIKWAMLLRDSGQPMQALQFMHLLQAEVPRQQLANIAVASLSDMDCADRLLLSWLESLPIDRSAKKASMEKVRHAMGQKDKMAKQMLDKNLQVIKDRWPRSAACIEESDTRGICVGRLPEIPWLFELKGGVVERDSYPLFFRRTGGLIPVLNPPHDPRGLVPRDRFSWYTRQIPGVIVGSLLGFDAIVNLATNRLCPGMVNMQQPLYLLEKDPTWARLVFENLDLSEVLKEERVRLFLGPRAVNDLKNMFLTNSRLLLPAMRISIDDDTGSALDEVIDRRNTSMKEYSGSWNSLYPPAFAGHAHDVLCGNSHQKARILLVTSLFSTVVQYIIRDLAQAFSKLGADVRVVKEKSAIERCDTRVVAGEIHNFHPHLLVIIDHLRPEYQGMLPANLPWVSWNQDPLANLFDERNISRLGSLDFSYTVSSVWVEQFRSLGYRHMEMLPFAANTDIYHPMDDPVEPNDEVVFITNMEPAMDFFPDFPGLQNKLERAFEEKDITYGNPRAMSELILNALGSHPGERKLASLVDVATWRFERWYDRRRVLRWLVDSGFRVGLYGRGWERDPEFKSMARGWVEQGSDLARLYRKSKAVLHVNSMVNTHQRVFECLASGGVVLARRTPYDDQPGELSSCLRPGEEIGLFGSAGELAKVLSRVFDDEQWRLGVISAGQKRVMKEHTYLARAQSILNDVRTMLGQQKARAA